jgi:hypothetical protein
MTTEDWRIHIDSFEHLDHILAANPDLEFARGRMSEASFFNLEQAVMEIWLERRGG